MDGFLQAEHHAATLVLAAEVVLVHRAVAGVGIISHAVLVQAGVGGFVAAEQCILAFPGPDARRHFAGAVAGVGIYAVVDLTGYGISDVMLHQRAQGVHHGDAIAAGQLYVIVADGHILVAVLEERGFFQRRPLKVSVGVGVAHRQAPAADAVEVTALYQHIGKAGRAGGGFVGREQGSHVDATVVHVLVVDVAVHIVDGEIAQRNAAACAFVLGHHSHAGALHLVGLGVTLAQNGTAVVGNF